MATAVTKMMGVLCTLTAPLTLGTNLGLLHILWALVSGALFPSRGALFPALQAIGLTPAETRQAGAALCYGSWQTADLLTTWEQHVTAEAHWQRSAYDGYYPGVMKRGSSCPLKLIPFLFRFVGLAACRSENNGMR